jgi:hypothetical protein
MAVALVNNPIAADAVDYSPWLIHDPVQSKQADRRPHTSDGISQLLTMLLEVVVPVTKGKALRWRQFQIHTYRR